MQLADRHNLLEASNAIGVKFEPTGSQEFGCSTDSSDYDFFGLGSVDRLDLLTILGWRLDSGSLSSDRTEFASLRRGNINLIICLNQQMYDRFKLATKVCREIQGPKRQIGSKTIIFPNPLFRSVI